MRIWAKVIYDQRIQEELVREAAQALSDTDFYILLTEICKELDLSCPAVLPKHLRDFRSFGRVVFRPADFMESVAFDSFELERIEDKKKNSKVTYYAY